MSKFVKAMLNNLTPDFAKLVRDVNPETVLKLEKYSERDKAEFLRTKAVIHALHMLYDGRITEDRLGEILGNDDELIEITQQYLPYYRKIMEEAKPVKIPSTETMDITASILKTERKLREERKKEKAKPQPPQIQKPPLVSRMKEFAEEMKPEFMPQVEKPIETQVQVKKSPKKPLAISNWEWELVKAGFPIEPNRFTVDLAKDFDAYVKPFTMYPDAVMAINDFNAKNPELQEELKRMSWGKIKYEIPQDPEEQRRQAFWLQYQSLLDPFYGDYTKKLFLMERLFPELQKDPAYTANKTLGKVAGIGTRIGLFFLGAKAGMLPSAFIGKKILTPTRLVRIFKNPEVARVVGTGIQSAIDMATIGKALRMSDYMKISELLTDEERKNFLRRELTINTALDGLFGFFNGVINSLAPISLTYKTQRTIERTGVKFLAPEIHELRTRMPYYMLSFGAGYAYAKSLGTNDDDAVTFGLINALWNFMATMKAPKTNEKYARAYLKRVIKEHNPRISDKDIDAFIDRFVKKFASKVNSYYRAKYPQKGVGKLAVRRLIKQLRKQYPQMSERERLKLVEDYVAAHRQEQQRYISRALKDIQVLAKDPKFRSDMMKLLAKEIAAGRVNIVKFDDAVRDFIKSLTEVAVSQGRAATQEVRVEQPPTPKPAAETVPTPEATIPETAPVKAPVTGVQAEAPIPETPITIPQTVPPVVEILEHIVAKKPKRYTKEEIEQFEEAINRIKSGDKVMERVMREAFTTPVYNSDKTDRIDVGDRRIFFEYELQKPDETTTMIIDINGLGQVNAILGHPGGDQMIYNVVKALMKIPGARIYRLGGDEFAVVTEEVKPHDIQEIIKIEPLIHEGEKTIPIGITGVAVRGAENKQSLFDKIDKKILMAFKNRFAKGEAPNVIISIEDLNDIENYAYVISNWDKDYLQDLLNPNIVKVIKEYNLGDRVVLKVKDNVMTKVNNIPIKSNTYNNLNYVLHNYYKTVKKRGNQIILEKIKPGEEVKYEAKIPEGAVGEREGGGVPTVPTRETVTRRGRRRVPVEKREIPVEERGIREGAKYTKGTIEEVAEQVIDKAKTFKDAKDYQKWWEDWAYNFIQERGNNEYVAVRDTIKNRLKIVHDLHPRDIWKFIQEEKAQLNDVRDEVNQNIKDVGLAKVTGILLNEIAKRFSPAVASDLIGKIKEASDYDTILNNIEKVIEDALSEYGMRLPLEYMRLNPEYIPTIAQMINLGLALYDPRHKEVVIPKELTQKSPDELLELFGDVKTRNDIINFIKNNKEILDNIKDHFDSQFTEMGAGLGLIATGGKFAKQVLDFGKNVVTNVVGTVGEHTGAGLTYRYFVKIGGGKPKSMHKIERLAKDVPKGTHLFLDNKVIIDVENREIRRYSDEQIEQMLREIDGSWRPQQRFGTVWATEEEVKAVKKAYHMLDIFGKEIADDWLDKFIGVDINTIEAHPEGGEFKPDEYPMALSREEAIAIKNGLVSVVRSFRRPIVHPYIMNFFVQRALKERPQIDLSSWIKDIEVMLMNPLYELPYLWYLQTSEFHWRTQHEANLKRVQKIIRTYKNIKNEVDKEHEYKKVWGKILKFNLKSPDRFRYICETDLEKAKKELTHPEKISIYLDGVWVARKLEDGTVEKIRRIELEDLYQRVPDFVKNFADEYKTLANAIWVLLTEFDIMKPEEAKERYFHHRFDRHSFKWAKRYSKQLYDVLSNVYRKQPPLHIATIVHREEVPFFRLDPIESMLYMYDHFLRLFSFKDAIPIVAALNEIYELPRNVKKAIENLMVEVAGGVNVGIKKLNEITPPESPIKLGSAISYGRSLVYDVLLYLYPKIIVKNMTQVVLSIEMWGLPNVINGMRYYLTNKDSIPDSIKDKIQIGRLGVAGMLEEAITGYTRFKVKMARFSPTFQAWGFMDYDNRAANFFGALGYVVSNSKGEVDWEYFDRLHMMTTLMTQWFYTLTSRPLMWLTDAGAVIRYGGVFFKWLWEYITSTIHLMRRGLWGVALMRLILGFYLAKLVQKAFGIDLKDAFVPLLPKKLRYSLRSMFVGNIDFWYKLTRFAFDYSATLMAITYDQIAHRIKGKEYPYKLWQFTRDPRYKALKEKYGYMTFYIDVPFAKRKIAVDVILLPYLAPAYNRLMRLVFALMYGYDPILGDHVVKELVKMFIFGNPTSVEEFKQDIRDENAFLKNLNAMHSEVRKYLLQAFHTKKYDDFVEYINMGFSSFRDFFENPRMKEYCIKNGKFVELPGVKDNIYTLDGKINYNMLLNIYAQYVNDFLKYGLTDSRFRRMITVSGNTKYSQLLNLLRYLKFHQGLDVDPEEVLEDVYEEMAERSYYMGGEETWQEKR